MPVIPKGIAPFTIKAPLTTGDKGEPSDSILKDAKRVFDFIEDERHLTALDLYKSVKSRVETWDRAHKRKIHKKAHKPNARSFLGVGGGRAAKRLEAATTPEDREFSDAKAFLQVRHQKIIKLEVGRRLLTLSNDLYLHGSLQYFHTV